MGLFDRTTSKKMNKGKDGKVRETVRTKNVVTGKTKSQTKGAGKKK